jgi:hypothetical protein
MEWRIPEKLTALNLVNIFPALYPSQRFITVFTKAHTYPNLSQLNPLHATLSPISLLFSRQA